MRPWVKNDKAYKLYSVSHDGDEAAVRALLGQGVHPDEWRDGRRWMALHAAAWFGHTGVAQLLIEARADIEAKDNIGGTPLRLAAIHDRLDVMRLLLVNGANVMTKDKDGTTALHTNAYGGNNATIETLLLWGADHDAPSNIGLIPRIYASFSGKTAIYDAAVARVRGLFWTRALHPRLPRPSREVVVTVLLCLRRVATTAAVPGTALRRTRRRPQLPALPVELWEMILGVVRAVDLIPVRV